jgi:hypothetical protein
MPASFRISISLTLFCMQSMPLASATEYCTRGNSATNSSCSPLPKLVGTYRSVVLWDQAGVVQSSVPVSALPYTPPRSASVFNAPSFFVFFVAIPLAFSI